MESLLLDRHRARKGEMVARAANAHGRRVERIESLRDRAPELVAEDRVGPEREVVAMLLDGSEREHDRVPTGVDLGLQLGPADRVEVECCQSSSLRPP